MGTLRTLFAISVVCAHSYGFVFVGGRNAVQLFYMISGFLISYVLVERKAYANARSFYINRYLRLYPIYIVVALLTLLAYTSASSAGKDVNFFKTYHDAPLAANLLLVFSNATLFLQDWIMFSGVQNDELVFTTSFLKSDVVLYHGLLVSQAWTLGVELAFYLIAPFVLTRKKILLLLLASSIATRVYLIKIGLGTSDPWIYRFFPTELALFLLGSLAHQVLLPYYRKVLSAKRMETYAKVSTYALIFITLAYWLTPIHELIKTMVLFSAFFILMPLVFVFQSRHAWDKRIGDLSYPIYICHMLVINVITFALAKLGISDKVIIGLAAILFSIAFSIALNRYIAKPVESLRNRFRETSTPLPQFSINKNPLTPHQQIEKGLS